MKQKDIEFPECWEEVRPTEWLHLLKIRDKLMRQPGLELVDIKREWCAYVLKNRGYRFRSKIEDMRLVDGLAKTLDWMWRAGEDEEAQGGTIVELTYDCTANLLPAWRYLRGPMSHGADLTFGEFRQAAAVVNKFNAEHDLADLRALCGILYRKPVKDKGCIMREPFRPQYMNRYMGLVRDMPVWIQWGIYAWFAYFCQYLFTGTFIIDGLELCFAPVFDRHKKSGGYSPGIIQNLGMNSVLYSVAESGIFGNVDATDDTLLLRVMMKLLDDKQRADEILRNLKK
ncbi:hypothetical protein AAE250_16315 [Bacteroides sp. GD17]|jgi:hypothetical protein|uniref:hypothetical protein n=1 Tax=Bacteroides sp. GD17 TaxID=3139826 RepID=UPI00204BC5C6|nr:hypothetical protein [uncultured Bacteroides sp.]DAV67211.1 MAG TPA: hypothetical protein [Caudoviricetes sp.]